jgi:holo-[acyl-carrier protein] synthase
MVLGIGIDQCEVPRVQRQLETPANGFVEAVFLPAEISYCQSKHRPAQHFAARFAAKEATVKALAGGGEKGAFWQEIEIVNDPDGRPRLELSGRLRALAAELGARRIHLSLTHTAEMAAAVVIAED